MLTITNIVIFDIDYTLVYGLAANQYYARYSRALETIVANKLKIPLDQAIQIISKVRSESDGRGELVLDRYKINPTLWYDEICKLDPSNDLLSLPKTVRLLRQLKQENKTIIALTDGPQSQIEKIFSATSIPINLFNQLIGWKRGQQKPKTNPCIFTQLAENNICLARDMTMIGDSYEGDISPALNSGVNTILIRPTPPSQYRGLNFASIEELRKALYGDR